MREHILALEEQARPLSPDTTARGALRNSVVGYAENFLANIDNVPAWVESSDKGAGLYELDIQENPRPIGELLETLRQHVDRPGLNPASGGHLAYVPGGGLFTAALGDYLAAIFNRYAGAFYASPGAVRMENMLLRWMAKLMGFPAESGGNLCSSGSIANLIGIVSARDAHGLKARDFEKTVVYYSSHLHHCVEKALRNAGLRECVRRIIPVDERCRIIPAQLRQAVQADTAAGLRPWLVVASAGTTNTGAVDPLTAIGQIAKEHGLWFHVDGAYGAFFILTEHGKSILRGIELADSIAMDPHKSLFLPYGTGAVIVRDARLLHDAYHYRADYMQDAFHEVEELSPCDLSPELSKHFRGLRLWLPLLLHGIAPFRAALDEKLLLARYFQEQMQAAPGFEVGPDPDLSITTFRYLPRSGNADDFNARLVNAVKQDGRIFLSSTILNGNYVIRMAIVSFRTTLATIDMALEIIRTKVAELEHE